MTKRTLDSRMIKGERDDYDDEEGNVDIDDYDDDDDEERGVSPPTTQTENVPPPPPAPAATSTRYGSWRARTSRCIRRQRF